MREPRTDEELLARLKAGDETAIRDVAETYGSKIYQLAFRYLRNKEDAEEVTQDVLYKVYRKSAEFGATARPFPGFTGFPSILPMSRCGRPRTRPRPMKTGTPRPPAPPSLASAPRPTA